MNDVRKPRLWLCVSAVLFLAGIVAGCARKGPAEIKIGWIGPLTGNLGYYGQAIKNATDIALEEINAAGGVNGKGLVIIYEDDQLEPTRGTTALQKLINVDRVPVVVQAAGSSVMLAEAPIAERRRVVLISPTCSNDKIRTAGDYIFRTWPSDAYQGEALARFAYGDLKKRRAAVLFISNDYGSGVKDEFANHFRRLGGQVVAVEAFEEGASDLRSQLAKATGQKPDLILLASHYKEAALALKQAKEAGISAQFIASDGSYGPDLITLSAGAAERSYVTNMHFDPRSSDRLVRGFVRKYKDRFGKEPEAYAAAGYDCLRVVAEAIRRGGTTGDGIKQALYAIRGFPGVTGEITFDRYGEVHKKYDIFRVTQGRFTLTRAAY